MSALYQYMICVVTYFVASHKSNPSSISQGVVHSYSTLGHVGGSNRCGGYTLLGVDMTHTG
jgi:hypothetical protein